MDFPGAEQERDTPNTHPNRMPPFTFRAEELESLLSRGAVLTPRVRERLEWFLYFSRCGSVSATCRRFTIARSTFYRWARRFNPSNLTTLEDAPAVPVGRQLFLPVTSRPAGADGHVGKGIVQAPDTRAVMLAPSAETDGHVGTAIVAGPAHGPEVSTQRTVEPPAVATGPGAPTIDLRKTLPDGPMHPWAAIARSLLIASVVSNVVFLTAFFTYAWMESRSANQTLRATTSSQPLSAPASSVSPAAPLSFLDRAARSLTDLFLIPTAEAAAGIYKPISYQGKITLTSGTAPSNGSYGMRFKVFTGATLGSPVWTEMWNSSNKVTMTGGLFSVQLGSITAMTGSVNFNTDNLYLQVEFDPANAGTYPEVFAPRRRFTAVPYALNADKLDGLDSTQFVRTDTGSTITTGTLRILSPGIGLSVSGTASGDSIHAQKILTSSGTFVVQGNALFRSTLTLNGVAYTFPTGDGSSSGKVLKTDSAGHLSWSTDLTGGGSSGFGTGNVITIGDSRYVNQSGDTMTGGLMIVNGGHTLTSIDAGLLLEVAGTASGRIFHAQDMLSSSGTLVVAGVSTFQNSVNVRGTLSGSALTIMGGNSYLLGNVAIGTSSVSSSIKLKMDMTNLSGSPKLVEFLDSSQTDTSDWFLTVARCSGCYLSGAHTGDMILRSAQTDDAFIITADNGATAAFTASGSRVGIGTTNPADLFQVSNGSSILEVSSGGYVIVGHENAPTPTPLLFAGKSYSTAPSSITAVVSSKVDAHGIGTVSDRFVGYNAFLQDTGVTNVSVTNATNASPIVITVSPAHSLVTGDQVAVSGVLGNTAANGLWKVTVIDSTTISLDGSTGNGGYTSRGIVTNRSMMTGFQCYAALHYARGGLSGSSILGSINHADDADCFTAFNPGSGTGTDAFYIGHNPAFSGSEWVTAFSSDANSLIGLQLGGTISVTALDLHSATLLTGRAMNMPNNAHIDGVQTDGTTNVPLIALNTSNNLSLRSNSLVIDSSKNVGIGTLAPGSRLSVSGALIVGGNLGSAAADAGLALEIIGVGSGRTLHAQDNLSSSGVLVVKKLAGASTGNILVVDTTGLVYDATDKRVGVGTAAPFSVIHAKAAASAFITLDNTANSRTAIVGVVDNFNAGMDSSGGGDILMRPGGTEVMRFRSTNASVGIGTGNTNPDAKLEVAGSMSGRSLFVMDLLASSGTLVVKGGATFQNTGLFTGNLTTRGTLSGAALTVMGGNSYFLGNLGIGKSGTPNTKLEVAGTMSGAALTVMAGNSYFRGSTAIGTSSVNTADVLLLDSTNMTSSPKYLEMQDSSQTDTADWIFTPARCNSCFAPGARVGDLVLRSNQTDDAFIVSADNGTTSAFTVSGSLVGIGVTKATARLSVSGSILVNASGNFPTTAKSGLAIEAMGTISGSALTVMGGNSYFLGNVGIGKSGTPNTKLEVTGTMSGAALNVSNLLSCTSLQTSNVGAFSCNNASYLATSTGALRTSFDARYVNTSGDTMTGALKITWKGGSSGQTLLNVLGTMSGRSLYVSGTGSGLSPLLKTNLPTGSVLIGTGGIKSGTGFMLPQLYVSGSSAPKRVGSGATSTAPMAIATQGRYAYVVNSGANLLQIFDTSNTNKPIVKGSIATGTNPRAIAVAGRYAYVTNSGSTTLQIFDVSNPAAPVSMSTFTTGAGPTSVYVQGQFAYVANYNANTLQIVDVSNPVAPVIAGSITINSNPSSVVVQGRYAYVVAGSTLQVVDVNNPSTPAVLSLTGLPALSTEVAVQGRYAYTAGATFQITDISTPTSTVIVGSIFLGINGSHGINIQGRYAYFVNAGTNTLQILDISNPTNPTSVGTVATGTYPQGMTVQGRNAYVVNAADKSLNIYDLGGSYIQQLEATSIEAGTLMLRNNLSAVDADFRGAVTILGGANIQRASDISSTSSGAYALTLTSHSGGLKIAAQGNVNQPHILFGTGTTFDTKLWRSAATTLRTNATFLAPTLSGGTLVVGNLKSCSTLTTDVNGNVSCGGMVVKTTTANQTNATTNFLQLPTFNMGANEQWIYQYNLNANSPSITPGWKFAVFGTGASAGATCRLTAASASGGSKITATTWACATAINISSSTVGRQNISVYGSILNGAKAGSGGVRWAENATSGTETVSSGSTLIAFKAVGSDIAEVYQANDPTILPGTVVSIDGSLKAGVKKSSGAYDSQMLGVVSSKPGMVIGGDDLGNAGGFPVYLALAGRVPVMVNDENGSILPGDFLTASSTPGIAMKATRPGAAVIGQAMTAFTEHGNGVVTIFVKNSYLSGNPVSTFLTSSGSTATGSLQSIAGNTQGLLATLTGTTPGDLAAQAALKDFIRTQVRQQVRSLSGSLFSSQPQPVTVTGSASSLTLRKDLSVGGAASFSGTLTTKGTLTADALVSEKTLMVAGDTSIGGDLYLGGMLKVASLFVPGLVKIDGGLTVGSLSAESGSIKHLTISRLSAGSGTSLQGTISLNGTLNLSGSLHLASGSTLSLSSLTVQSALHVLGNVTIEGVASFLSDVTVKGRLTVADQLILSARQAGEITIPKSGTSAIVRFDPPFATKPIVTAASNDFIYSPWRVTRQTMTGFAVELASPAQKDVTFSWISVGVQAASGSSLSSSTPSASAAASLLPFPVDVHGVPLTGNAIEDECLRNHTPLDQDGHPYDCNRYHLEHVWQYGTLTFGWNTLVDPPLLTPPDGYRIVVQETPPATTTGSTLSGTGNMTGSGTTMTGTGSTTGGSGTGSTTGSGTFTHPVGTIKTGSGSEKGSGSTTGSGTLAPPEGTGSGGTVTADGSGTGAAAHSGSGSGW